MESICSQLVTLPLVFLQQVTERAAILAGSLPPLIIALTVFDQSG